MKKQYVNPEMQVIAMEVEAILSGTSPFIEIGKDPGNQDEMGTNPSATTFWEEN